MNIFYYSYRYGPELAKVYMLPQGLSLPVDRIMKTTTEHQFGWSGTNTKKPGLIRPMTKDEYDMLDAFDVPHITFMQIMRWENNGEEIC